jgi:serine/threonine-protein kinase
MAGVWQDAPAATDAGPGRVLLVDDQPELRRLFQRALTKSGYEVVTAENGRMAVELVAVDRFDAVISDVRMPDMGGVELLQALHAEDPDLPVLLVSGSPDLATALKAVEFGAFEYLTKPVSFDKLATSTKRAIEVRRERAQGKELLQQFRSGTRPRTRDSAGPARDSWTGELLGRRYRVGRLLGAGGMGAVYEATREDLGQMRVAVKILHASLASDAALLARFRREAETVGQINHPNIVRILDFQAEEGEPAYLVMELLDGISLRQAMARHMDFSAERIVFIASQILAALAAVHRARVIHRDIKPENVHLTSMSGLGDIVKLLDFGVAKQLSAVPGNTLTQTGMVLGTPTYMAPEQARGGPADRRCDLYAIGTVMYEALAGRAPYAGDNYNALLYAIQQGQPVRLTDLRPDLDSDLIAVVSRAMATDPDERFQTAEEMAAALGPWLTLTAPASTPPESAAAAFAPTVVPASKPPRER